MLRMKSKMAALMVGATVVGTTVAPAFAGEDHWRLRPANPTRTGAYTNANSDFAYSGLRLPSQNVHVLEHPKHGKKQKARSLTSEPFA
jgi:hypothetical protein